MTLSHKIRWLPRKCVSLAAVLVLANLVYAQTAPTPQTQRSRVRMPIFSFDAAQPEAVLAPQGDASQSDGWEAQSVSAPAVLVKRDTLFLFYTAEDRVRLGSVPGTSRIGLAYSIDGVHFTRLPEPVLAPTLDFETPGGCKNPSVVFAEEVYYMTYLASDGRTTRLALATSKDLRRWQKHGLALRDTAALSGGVMLPQKLGGRFVMYYTKEELRLAFSNDLLHWFPQMEPLLRLRADKFDSDAIEVGPPPMIIDSTIALLYNARDAGGKHALGMARFSMDNPATLLARSDQPLFELLPTPAHGESTAKASGLVQWRGQYEMFYSNADGIIHRTKARLLFSEKK